MYQQFLASSLLDEIQSRINSRQEQTGFLHDAPRRSVSASPASQRAQFSHQPRVLPPYVNGGISLTRGRTFTYNDPRIQTPAPLQQPPQQNGHAVGVSQPPQRPARQRSALYREYRERTMLRENSMHRENSMYREYSMHMMDGRNNTDRNTPTPRIDSPLIPPRTPPQRQASPAPNQAQLLSSMSTPDITTPRIMQPLSANSVVTPRRQQQPVIPPGRLSARRQRQQRQGATGFVEKYYQN